MSTHTMELNTVNDASCPYEDIVTDICRASLSLMKPGMMEGLKFCAGEDYDGCPIFLAKILRTR